MPEFNENVTIFCVKLVTMIKSVFPQIIYANIDPSLNTDP